MAGQETEEIILAHERVFVYVYSERIAYEQASS